MVQSVKSVGKGKYKVYLKGYVVDNCEQIDELHIELDDTGMGYSVSFMQLANFGKRGNKLIEYDSSFVYC
jgi:hypothetical protein